MLITMLLPTCAHWQPALITMLLPTCSHWQPALMTLVENVTNAGLPMGGNYCPANSSGPYKVHSQET